MPMIESWECTNIPKKRRQTEKRREKCSNARLHFSPHCVVCPWGDIVWCATRYGCVSSEQQHQRQQQLPKTKRNARRHQKKKQRKTSARKKHVQLNSAYIAITKERKLSYSKWTTKRRVKKKNERKTTMPNDCSVWVCEIANIFPSSPLSRTQSENSFVHQIIKSFASLPLQSENSI